MAARLMFSPKGQIRMLPYGTPVDMRKSLDGLSALAADTMGHGSAEWPVARVHQSAATQIKGLYLDRSGFCVWARRPEAGPQWLPRGALARDGSNRTEAVLLEGFEPWRQSSVVGSFNRHHESRKNGQVCR